MKYKMLACLLGAVLCLITVNSYAATTPVSTHPTPGFSILEPLSSMSMKKAQETLGRKFTLREKLGFLVLKQQLKRARKKGFENTQLYRAMQKKSGAKKGSEGSKGQSALAFGIAALALLILALFVPHVIFISPIAAILAIVLGTVAKKRDPDDTNGKVGKLLGWISLGLFALLILAVAIAISGAFW